jgi:DNA polymerase-3 subunit delta
MTAPIPAVLVLGDDPYLVSEAVAKALGGIDPLSVEDLHALDDREQVLSALESTSLFGGRRAVVVRAVEEAPAELQRGLVAYLQDPNPDCLLLLVSGRAVAALGDAVRAVGHVVEAGRGRRNDLFGWLRDKARALGLRLAGDAPAILLETVGEERMALAQALEELSLALGAGAVVGPEDVERQFGARTQANLFSFLDATATGQTGTALVAMRRLVDRGEAPQALLGALTRHVRLMIEVGEGPASRAAKALGLNPFRAEKLVKQASGYAPPALALAYRAMAESDRRLKAGEEADDLALERAVIALSSLRRPGGGRDGRTNRQR